MKKAKNRDLVAVNMPPARKSRRLSGWRAHRSRSSGATEAPSAALAALPSATATRRRAAALTFPYRRCRR